VAWSDKEYADQELPAVEKGLAGGNVMPADCKAAQAAP
jgi:hypothetical protein